MNLEFYFHAFLNFTGFIRFFYYDSLDSLMFSGTLEKTVSVSFYQHLLLSKSNYSFCKCKLTDKKNGAGKDSDLSINILHYLEFRRNSTQHWSKPMSVSVFTSVWIYVDLQQKVPVHYFKAQEKRCGNCKQKTLLPLLVVLALFKCSSVVCAQSCLHLLPLAGNEGVAESSNNSVILVLWSLWSV